VLSTRSSLEHGQRDASYDTSLVVSDGDDCRRRRRNVYDKKPQRYAKDNRTAHLTARSDKSVAYVTINKRLYAMFCTVDWQTRSIARPLCDSRATCLFTFHGRIFSGFSGCVRDFFLSGHNGGTLIITRHASLWEGDRDSPALFSNTGFHFQDLPHTQHVGCTDIVSFFLPSDLYKIYKAYN